jgi:hypothetical protein
LRRIAALSGPLAFAAANFVVLAILQQTVGAAEFGLFGFMQITIATGMGLVNGVFGTPLALALGEKAEDKRAVIGSFFVCWLVFLVLGATFSTFIGTAAGASGTQMPLLAAATVGMWFRWFVRSLAIALGRQGTAAISDIVYGATSALSLAAVLGTGPLSIEFALGIQIVACLVSLLPTLPTTALLVGSIPGADTARYRREFARSGRWSSLLVVTSDVVANIHAYGVTLLFGSAAYAPIALATLMFRPHGVILTGLVSFERPRLVAKARDGDAGAMRHDLRFMHGLLLFTWVGNSVAVFGLLALFGDYVLGGEYVGSSVAIAVSLISAIVLLRSLREPIVAALQALLLGRQAAMFSLIGAATTAPIAILMLVLARGEPTWSLLGAVAGEAVFLACAGWLLVRDRQRQAAA